MTGLVFGAFVGGAAGLLLAPRKGRETREQLKKELTDTIELGTTIQESYQHVTEQAAELAEMSRELIPPLAKETKQLAADFRFKTEPRFNIIAEQIEKIKKETDAYQQTIKNL